MVLDFLDVNSRNFITLCSFHVMASGRADGQADISPRGDRSGSLTRVLYDRTLLLPDWPESRNVDTLKNLVERS